MPTYAVTAELRVTISDENLAELRKLDKNFDIESAIIDTLVSALEDDREVSLNEVISVEAPTA